MVLLVTSRTYAYSNNGLLRLLDAKQVDVIKTSISLNARSLLLSSLPLNFAPLYLPSAHHLSALGQQPSPAASSPLGMAPVQTPPGASGAGAHATGHAVLAAVAALNRTANGSSHASASSSQEVTGHQGHLPPGASPGEEVPPMSPAAAVALLYGLLLVMLAAQAGLFM